MGPGGVQETVGTRESWLSSSQHYQPWYKTIVCWKQVGSDQEFPFKPSGSSSHFKPDPPSLSFSLLYSH